MLHFFTTLTRFDLEPLGILEICGTGKYMCPPQGGNNASKGTLDKFHPISPLPDYIHSPDAHLS
jgi:hypothetical protein